MTNPTQEYTSPIKKGVGSNLKDTVSIIFNNTSFLVAMSRKYFENIVVKLYVSNSFFWSVLELLIFMQNFSTGVA